LGKGVGYRILILLFMVYGLGFRVSPFRRPDCTALENFVDEAHKIRIAWPLLALLGEGDELPPLLVVLSRDRGFRVRG